jgi:hypothetical protein
MQFELVVSVHLFDQYFTSYSKTTKNWVILTNFSVVLTK